MRILYVNNNYLIDGDGSARSTQLLAENMATSGHDVAVFCVNNKNKVLDIEFHNNVTIYRGHGGLRDFYRATEDDSKWSLHLKVLYKILTVYNPSIRQQFKSVLNQFKPDIVHTNSITGTSLYIWVIARKNSYPVIHTQRDYSMYNPSDIVEKNNKVSFCQKIPLMFYRFVCKAFSKNVNIIASPSKYTLRVFRENGYYTKSVIWECIPNSVMFNEREFKKNLINRRKDKNKNFTFIFAGKLVLIKGIKQLVEAFKAIDNPVIRLVICGSGPLEKYVLNAMVDDGRIIYKGLCNYKELSSEYQKANALVVPSLWEETFGRVVIEANYHGLPTIVSNRGGMPEIISEMGGGVIYDADDPVALKNVMVEISSTRNFENFYDCIESNMYKYSIQYQIEGYKKLYSQLER